MNTNYNGADNHHNINSWYKIVIIDIMNQNNNNSSSSSLLIRKRKRNVSTTTKVHFCTKPNEIIDTYSALEYDRSGLYDQYNNNELPINHHQDNNNNNNNKNNIIFTLSINFIPTTTTITNTTSLSTTNDNKSLQNKKKPKLSIDTSNIHGPLYFTNMSTNHQKKDQTSRLYHEDDNITLKNTEFNRRSLVLVA
ncbi:unnamed protein product [Cunninghamella echinulata]